jgi:phosphatidylglycerol:prolipoprotein diacylglycerol transferase
VCFILGVLSSYFSFSYLNKQLTQPFSSKQLKKVFILVYLSSYFGARIMSICREEQVLDFSDFFFKIFELGSLSFYGGMLASFVACYCYLGYTKQKLDRYLDIGVPSCLLGLAIVRVGCFLNGDDYGIQVPHQDAVPPWWTVSFPNHPNPIPRYPTQLFESFLVFSAFLIFNNNFKKIKRVLADGSLGLLGIITYTVIRFFDDFLRDDHGILLIARYFSFMQIISLIIFFISVFILYQKNQKTLAAFMNRT